MNLLRLSISIPRPATGAALVSALLTGTALPAASQDTTVIGADGSDSGVTVNMGVLDQGRAPSAGPSAERGRSGRVQLRRPGGAGKQDAQPGEDAEPGEPGAGPTGRVLRFPPLDDPKSRLTVDPNALADRGRRQDPERQQTARPQLEKPGPGARSAQTGGQSGGESAAQDTRDSRLTPEGREMADGAERPSPGLPEAPRPRDGGNAATGAPGTAGTEDGGTRTADTQTGLDSPQPITPETKPEREGRAPRADTQTAGTPAPAPKPKTKPDRETAESQTATASQTGTARGDGQTRSASADTGTASADDRTSPTASPETGGGRPDGAGEPADAGADEPPAAGGTDATGADTTQTAKRTPGDSASAGKIQLDFAPGSAKLSDKVRDQLAGLADRLSDKSEQRVQLMAFAEGGEEGASQARRLSLSRALAVRSFLINKGIRSTRMDVRALGDTATDGPLDRVDIVPVKR